MKPLQSKSNNFLAMLKLLGSKAHMPEGEEEKIVVETITKMCSCRFSSYGKWDNPWRGTEVTENPWRGTEATENPWRGTEVTETPQLMFRMGKSLKRDRGHWKSLKRDRGHWNSLKRDRGHWNSSAHVQNGKIPEEGPRSLKLPEEGPRSLKLLSSCSEWEDLWKWTEVTETDMNMLKSKIQDETKQNPKATV